MAERLSPYCNIYELSYMYECSIEYSMRDLAEWLERLTANVEVVAAVLGSIPASSDTGESEGVADETV